MTDLAVTTEIHDSIAVVTLNRPAALNSLDMAMVDGLRRAIYGLERNDAVRCVVIKGAGEHFMAGGDLKLFRSWLDLDEDERRLMLDRLLGDVHAMVMALRRMPKPVIASVRGAAAGFGLSLMMACDLAVAAEDAVFTLAYCKIGTSPDGSSTYSLPRLVGMKKAMELAMLGDRFDAAEAYRLGLLNKVVPAESLEDETMALARRLAEGPREALARTKRLLVNSLESTLPEQVRAEEEAFADCAMTFDFAEGVGSFIEKRPAKFQGR